MKQLRWIAVAFVLAVVAAPTYAACGFCGYSEVYEREVCMVRVPYPTTCFGGYNVGGNPCVQYNTACGYSASVAELSDTYSIASVEVTRPDGSRTVSGEEQKTIVASNELRN